MTLFQEKTGAQKPVGIFNDDFINDLPQDPIAAVLMVCDHFLEVSAKIKEPLNDYDKFVDALGFFEAFIDAYKIAKEFNCPEIGPDRDHNVKNINQFFASTYKTYDEKYQKQSLARSKSRYSLKFGKAFLYELTQDELLGIQKVIAELRTLVSKNTKLDAKYRSRLQKRLSRLQIDLQKKMSNLDPLWGIVGEDEVIHGKVGKKGNAIVSTLQRLTKIIRIIQFRAEGVKEEEPPSESNKAPKK